MDTMEAILTRRSVRRFTDEPVGEELVAKLLEAGMAAPSAHNEQPWHFVVITERAILDEIPRFHRYGQMLKEAPTAIAVCADLNLEAESGSGYWIQDCAAATQNILLAAHGLGLGACWLGMHPREERKGALRELLKLPGHVEPLSVIALGHAAKLKPPSERYREERVHRNHWGGNA